MPSLRVGVANRELFRGLNVFDQMLLVGSVLDVKGEGAIVGPFAVGIDPLRSNASRQAGKQKKPRQEQSSHRCPSSWLP
jgi:hypothetical protein